MSTGLDSEALIQLILTVQNAFGEHYLLYQSTIEAHRGIIDRMWVLAQRYTIIIRGVPSKYTNPADSSHQIEDAIKTEFYAKHNTLGDSNSKLMLSLSNLKNTWSTIDRTLVELGISQLSSLDGGETIQPPISYFIEILADCLKFFAHSQSKLNCFAMLLTPDNASSLERYKKLLQPNKEFDYHFSVSTAYCNCLRSHKTAKT